MQRQTKLLAAGQLALNETMLNMGLHKSLPADEGIAGWMISCLGDFQPNDHEYNTTKTVFSSHPMQITQPITILHLTLFPHVQYPPIVTFCEALHSS